MSNLTRSLMMGAGGVSAGGDPVYADDVYATRLYRGDGGTQTITNGIDLEGEGGMVWLKPLNQGQNWCAFDTHRGLLKSLRVNSTSPQHTATASNEGLGGFNNNGFSVKLYQDATGINNSANDMCSWTFRKCPGFFDIVTYTGNGSVQNISHSLASVPGMIMVKNLDSTTNWEVYHRGLDSSNPQNYKIELNEGAGRSTNSNVWNDTAPTSTQFTVGTNNSANGANYVAYLFAHDAQVFGDNTDESIVKCGSLSYTGGTPLTVDLGWEPQFVITKKKDGGGEAWMLTDTQRSMIDGNGNYVQPNTSNSEGDFGVVGATPTGFIFDPGTQLYATGEFIYTAIRRFDKPPTAGTDVFTPMAADAPTNANNKPEKVDMYWFTKRNGYSDGWEVADRARGFQNTNANSDDSYTSGTLVTSTTAKQTTSNNAICQQDGSTASGGPYVRAISSGNTFINYVWKRAPGFFDIVTWRGTSGGTQNVSHNLRAVPEMVISKMYDYSSSYGGDQWYVYHKNLGTDTGGNSDNYHSVLGLNTTASQTSSSGAGIFGSVPTATNLPFDNPSYDSLAVTGNTNAKYVAYLFGTVAGISKVGYYTGNGSSQDINCGFTSGARFLMIKRVDSSGDWIVYDSARGMGAGNDKFLRLNNTGTELTYDDVGALNSGFTIKNGSTVSNINGAKYIFWAIA